VRVVARLGALPPKVPLADRLKLDFEAAPP
jgi:hypothetical protein